MKGFIAWFIENEVAANLLMVFIVVGGLISLFTSSAEIFPELDPDYVSVSIVYPGAAPEEVEEGVTVRVEEELQDLEDVKEITSSSAEGVSSVLVEARRDVDLTELKENVQSRVDAIDTFPEDIEQPIVEKLEPKRQVINIAIYGQVSDLELKAYAEELRDDLLLRPGISQVTLAVRPYEIAIELSQESLRHYHLTFQEVAQAVREFSIDVPGGLVEGPQEHLLVRTKGQAYTKKDFEHIPLRSSPTGATLYIKDVATVIDGLEDSKEESYFNGAPAALVRIFRTSDEDVIDIAEEVKAYVAEKRQELPSTLSLQVWQDRTTYLRDRLSLLVKNARLGILLVFAVLALFLKFSLAFWVTLGIPISFMGTFLVLPELGVTINMISLFAFILVLGIVVDDAIIVGEQIFSEREKGARPREAARKGTLKVAGAVVFSVLTTVAAFFALTSVPGNFGVIFSVISFIVIATLLFSLVESLAILPVHLANDPIERFWNLLAPWGKRQVESWGTKGERQKKTSRALLAFAGAPLRFKEKVFPWMERVNKSHYQPLLQKALHHRFLTIVSALSLLIVTVGVIRGGWLRFSFFPQVDADYIAAGIRMPEGTAPEITAVRLKTLENALVKAGAEIEKERGEDVFRYSYVVIGEQPFSSAASRRGGGGGTGGSTQGNVGEVIVELSSPETRETTAREVERRWRKNTGVIVGAEKIEFNSALFSAGEDINVQITGDNFAALRQATDKIKNVLESYPGVYDITDTDPAGKRELNLSLTPTGVSSGATLFDLGRQARRAFYGEEAQRIQRGRDDVKVMVRYPREERESPYFLETMRLRLPSGAALPLGEVAHIEEGQGYSTIRRIDRRRAITVTAKVDETQNQISRVNEDLQNELETQFKKAFPKLSFSFGGSATDRQEAIEGLVRGFVVALLVIYALIAIPFRSYLQPIIIMFAIPFGLIGAALGHVLLGLPITILSMFGLIALSGVVVNDGIVLVSFINELRDEGEEVLAAVLQGGQERFRAVIMTSVTTFAGLTPMIFERSTQAQFLVPIAVSLGFGILFATGITLLLVPAGYLVLEDVRTFFRRKIAAQEKAGEKFRLDH